MGQGFDVRAGIKLQSAFNTALAVDTILPFLSETINRNRPPIARNYLSGISGRKAPDFPVEHCAGDLSGEMVIDEIATDPIGFEHILLGALGSNTWQIAESSNRYIVADNLDSFTIAFLKRGSIIWENIGCMVNTLELTGSAADQVCTWNAGIIGYKQLLTGDAGIVNLSSTFDGLTPANEPSRALFSDLVIRVADTADALAAADQINVSEFSLSINNNLEDPVFATPDNSTHTTGEFPMEFIRNGLREVILNLTLPRYETEDYYANLLAADTLQADLIWTVGSYSINVFLPLVKVVGPSAPVSGAEVYPHNFTLEAHYNKSGAVAQNTVMKFLDGTTNITGDIAIEVVSKRTAVIS